MDSGIRQNDENTELGGDMAVSDKCCSIAPYFKVPDENLDAFKQLCERFVAKTREETKCLYYGFTFNGNEAYCREGYADADALLKHVENVGDLLEEAMKIAEVTRLEIHGPEAELAKLRGPLADHNATFFTLECGFRN